MRNFIINTLHKIERWFVQQYANDTEAWNTFMEQTAFVTWWLLQC